MQKWEYLTTLLQAESEKQLPWLQEHYPDIKKFAKYAYLALIPQMDKLGEEGWELVSCEPVKYGDNLDLMIAVNVYGQMNPWTYTYLCVFKRPKE